MNGWLEKSALKLVEGCPLAAVVLGLWLIVFAPALADLRTEVRGLRIEIRDNTKSVAGAATEIAVLKAELANLKGAKP